MTNLDEPLRKVLGDKTAKVLDKGLDLHTARDLLHHYPRRYAHRGELTPLAELEDGEHVTVMAEVVKVQGRTLTRSPGYVLEITVTDGTGELKLSFFGRRGSYVAERDLSPGTRGLFAGKISTYRPRSGRPQRQLAHPQYKVVPDRAGEAAAQEWADEIIPIYPSTKGLDIETIGQSVGIVLDQADLGDDPLPAAVRAAHRLADQRAAYEGVHRPRSWDDLGRARKRLKWDEAFVLQVALAQRRRAAAGLPATARPRAAGGLLDAFDARLPFTLTDGQRTVGDEIAADLARAHPMHRLLQGDVGAGKAQPLDAGVLTPAGYRPMGEMGIGTEVITPGGEATVVTGVFPQGEREVYRLVFSDGTSVECDDEHLWPVKTDTGWHRGGPLKVLTTRELRADLLRKSGTSKWYLPLLEAPELDDLGERPVDPYLLGLLLGDGSLLHGRVEISTQDEEIVQAVAELVPDGCRMRRKPSRPLDWQILGERRGAGNPLIVALRRLGVHELRAHGKHVPPAYLAAPAKARHALLQGLLDTDGTLRAEGRDVSFTSASERLAEDVAWLTRSLGGYARCRPVTRAGGRYWTTSVALPDAYAPFRLPRKASKLRPHTKYERRRKGIRAIEYVGRKQVQCISVAHPDRLYVTDGWTPTHNTIVALRAMLQVVDGGGQAALLAPTEVLAQQHYRSITGMLGELAQAGQIGGAERATRVALLTGSQGARARKAALLEAASGGAGIVVGTHALLEGHVQFADLGLVVVDEQHRFGVEQRDALREKVAGGRPHVLVMTATPIPRTVAMTVFGDLETSVLGQLPAGRSEIRTHVVPPEKPAFLARTWERIREEAGQGRQIYIVCPRIGGPEGEEGEAPPAEEGERRSPLGIMEVLPRLEGELLAGLRIGVLHGRLHPDEKDAVMRRFAAGELDVLLATTVIEVGVDVPNATVMVIMDADRFGVSQLHQLRGRVGRGKLHGLCLLVTDAEAGGPARDRLDAVASTTDGFKLSRLDLEQRREGDVLGAAQAGRASSLKMLTLLRDEEVIREAREEAARLVDGDPELARHPGLAAALASLLDADRTEYLEKA
ncbi:DEAD/DEAH box helicase [Actinomadura sp. PM05-2]|uniref:Probable DNA 3'-5' helicase RecG n=1 Tax=Actinomadura parmotrematis TaxID=2864039 RepID=A0ABS7G025_9ACTN|nr:helicase-related protein [Actinomadura parmotrematis]MBW8486058.1 DEAD/DEAH box helicase [Actinomadura parmotrematis]